MRVVPIDIDFAGWSEVAEGEANAWGIVNSQNELVVARKTRADAEEKMARLKAGDA